VFERRLRLALPAFLVPIALSLVLIQPVAAAPTELIADLTGGAEVPGPGDPDGAGFASVTLDPETGEVCFFIDSFDIGEPTAAHIHSGAAGVAGPPVVTFTVTLTPEGFIEDCVDGQDSTVLQAIVDDPASYYVNVHNAEFPDGAIRGQLGEPPVVLFAELDGTSEVPGPGDPDGSGSADVSFPMPDQVCYFIGYGGIGTPTAAHIHSGLVGEAGPPIVTFDMSTATDEFVEACVTGQDPAVLEAIIADPASYYLNIHTGEFPDGAIRGQLTDEPPPPPTCPPGEICNGLVSPGIYTWAGFGAAMTFTTDHEWFAFVAPDGFGLNSEDLPGAFYAFEVPAGVYTGSCGADEGTIAQTVQGFIDHLASHPNITVDVAPSPVTVGGASGIVIEVTGTDTAECPGGIARLFSGEVGPGEPPEAGDFVIADGEHIRFWVLDVDGQAILLAVDAFDGAVYAGLLAQAQSILDTMTFALSGGPAEPTPVPSVSPAASPSASPGTLPDTSIGSLKAPSMSAWALLAFALAGSTTTWLLWRAGRRP
jgi:hypothetical protein